MYFAIVTFTNHDAFSLVNFKFYQFLKFLRRLLFIKQIIIYQNQQYSLLYSILHVYSTYTKLVIKNFFREMIADVLLVALFGSWSTISFCAPTFFVTFSFSVICSLRVETHLFGFILGLLKSLSLIQFITLLSLCWSLLFLFAIRREYIILKHSAVDVIFNAAVFPRFNLLNINQNKLKKLSIFNIIKFSIVTSKY
jgi:hypothetical protein